LSRALYLLWKNIKIYRSLQKIDLAVIGVAISDNNILSYTIL